VHGFEKSYLPPAVVGMLSRVLDEAWKDLAQDERVLTNELTREQVAKRIMNSALLGERNPARLKAAAKKPA
jgi:hypothetical protein